MATGIIGKADDPKTKASGRYYVTEKFVGAPDGLNDYVGLMDIIKNYDNQNGEIIRYYTAQGLFYLKKFAGGWRPSWVLSGIQDAPSDGKMYVRQNGAWVEFKPNSPAPPKQKKEA